MAPELILGGTAGRTSGPTSSAWGRSSARSSPAGRPTTGRRPAGPGHGVRGRPGRGPARLGIVRGGRGADGPGPHCLSVDPARRPRDAGEVESRLTAYLDGAANGSARPSWPGRGPGPRRRGADPATAGGRPGRARSSALVALGGRRRRLDTRQRLAQWEQARRPPRGGTAPGPGRRRPGRRRGPWLEAREAVRLARIPLARAATRSGRGRRTSAGRSKGGLAAAEADHRLLGSLELPRALAVERKQEAADAAYGAAFREAGLDVDHRDPTSVGRAVARRPAGVKRDVAAALDGWAIVRRTGPPGRSPTRPVAEAAGGGPRRRPGALAGRPPRCPGAQRPRGQRPTGRGRGPGTTPGPEPLAPGPNPDRAGRHAGGRRRSSGRAWRAYPEDFWINLDLAHALVWSQSPLPEEAERHALASVVLRPGSAGPHMGLALLRHRRGDRDGAEAEYLAALRLRPDDPASLYNLGNLLADLGRVEESVASYRRDPGEARLSRRISASTSPPRCSARSPRRVGGRAPRVGPRRAGPGPGLVQPRPRPRQARRRRGGGRGLPPGRQAGPDPRHPDPAPCQPGTVAGRPAGRIPRKFPDPARPDFPSVPLLARSGEFPSSGPPGLRAGARIGGTPWAWRSRGPIGCIESNHEPCRPPGVRDLAEGDACLRAEEAPTDRIETSRTLGRHP